ncbi:MAG: Na/Pi cotransporter family protein, partial [Solobacterium sp.]|nr:Na/Pi cotransporter family protein [Solobacterium sp.]
GFGILFVGLMNMSAAVSSMSQALSSFLVSFEGNYLLGFFAGVLTTAIIQSSSAVVGILQSVASSVGIKFCAVFAVILGVNIGDCLTTYLVCRIGARPDQIRTCLVHIIYNVVALVLITVGLTALRMTNVLNDGIWYMTLNSGGVANVHGLFRLIPAVCLLPFTGVFASIAEKLVPDAPVDKDEELDQTVLRELDTRLLDNPGLALTEVSHLILHMGTTVAKNYNTVFELAEQYDEKKVRRMQERESVIDRMADAANNYLLNLSPHISLQKDENDQNFQMKAIICFERMGDLCINVMNAIKDAHEAERSFSDDARRELSIISEAVREILEITVEAYRTGSSETAKLIEPYEEVIDELIDELKDRHLYRMRSKQCGSTVAILFNDILQNMERISDQCSDLGVYALAKNSNYIRGMEHRYIHNLHHNPDEAYQEAFRRNYNKYFGMLASKSS